jgi:hypothetical protein
MDNIVLLYDKWKFNKPIPNCIKPEILSHIFVTDRLIDSFELENKFGNQHSSWISNLGIKDIKLEITDNIESENWVYPIEPWGHLMYSLNIEATDDFCNFFDLIPSNIIKKVNQNKGKIVINYSHEGWVGDWLLKGMYLGIKNAGIKFENVILILNDYNLEQKLLSFKERFNITEYPSVINYSFYLTASSKHFFNKHINKDLYNTHYILQKPFKFLCLNRRLDLHRVKLLSEIFNKIQYDSIISFDKTLVTNELSNFYKKHSDLKEKFEALPAKSIADREDIANTNGYYHENENLFLESYISLVTETSFYIDNDFISEKIWKPIFQYHPFIVIGRPHMLKYLKEIGFKTFDFLIDETYDTIEDNDIRMDVIINEIDRLNKLSIYEIDDIIKDNFHILKHNHQLMIDIGKNNQVEKYLIEKIKHNNYRYSDIFKELKIHKNDNII